MGEAVTTEEREVQLRGIKNSTDDNYYPMGKHSLHGRRQIFTGVEEITPGNVLEVLNQAIPIHLRNRSEEVYLEKYARGIQPILNRVKQYNDEICNKAVVNLANEILSFKTADFAGEPIQYVSRGKSTDTPDKIESLNSMMLSEGKPSKDMELANQMFLYGVGYRLTIQDQDAHIGDDFTDEAPFEIYTTDSRNSFVVKYNDVTKRVVMGVNYVFLDEANNKVRYTAYTNNATYTIEGTAQRADVVTKTVKHNFGMVNLVEYPCNSSYMGCFEVVLDLLDSYNTTLSDRLDGVEQFIQALMVFEGVDISRDEFLELKDLGAIKIPPALDGSNRQRLYYLNQQLDQQQTQTLVDNIKQTILEIVGMPSQGNANTSDSSNNGAMIIKNGWWHAESRMLETEGHWKKSETEFLKVVLKICGDFNLLDGLKVSNVEPKLGRHSYQDLLVKTQSFTTLMSANVPPIQAYKYSGLDSDPEAASLQYEEYQKQRAESLDEMMGMTREIQATGLSRGGQEESQDDTRENDEERLRRLGYRRRKDADGDGIVDER